MKKLFLAFTAMTLLMTGCSSDDSDTNAQATNIMIDGVAFNAAGAVAPFFNASTTFQQNSQMNSRSFSLISISGGIENSEQLSLNFLYPLLQTSINGTYTINSDDFDDENISLGMYTKGSNYYGFDSGTITVTDLGNSKFKLQFNNVVAIDIQEVLPSKTLTGSYEGTFTLMQ